MANQAKQQSISKNPTNPQGSFAVLGARLTKAWEAYTLARPAYEKACARYNRLLYRAMKREGMTVKQFFTPAGRSLDRRLRAEAKISGPRRRVNRTNFNMRRIAEAIDALKPETAGDLAVLANSLTITCYHLWWEKVEALDLEHACMRRLIETTVAVGGQKLILAGHRIPQAVEQDALRRIADGE